MNKIVLDVKESGLLKAHEELTKSLFGLSQEEYTRGMQYMFSLSIEKTTASIFSMGLSSTIQNALLRAGIRIKEEIPRTIKELKQIPGIGDITARVILGKI